MSFNDFMDDVETGLSASCDSDRVDELMGSHYTELKSWFDAYERDPNDYEGAVSTAVKNMLEPVSEDGGSAASLGVSPTAGSVKGMTTDKALKSATLGNPTICESSGMARTADMIADTVKAMYPKATMDDPVVKIHFDLGTKAKVTDLDALHKEALTWAGLLDTMGDYDVELQMSDDYMGLDVILIER